MHAREREGTRGQSGVSGGLVLARTLFKIVFLNCSIIVQLNFLQILVEFISIQKLKVVGLVELKMTRDNHVWWWNFKNQRIANLDKVRLFHIIKSSNFA
jgi:hypothetical protein